MASTASSEVLRRILQYEERISNQRMELEQHTSSEALEGQLDTLIARYEARIQRKEHELEKAKAETNIHDLSVVAVPSDNARERMRQLQATTTAYEKLTPTKPDLPEADSLVPMLFAIKDVNESIIDAKSTIEAAVSHLQSLEQQVRNEEAHISDADSLVIAMDTRMARLQAAQDERISKPSEELARDFLKTKQRRIKHFVAANQKVRAALDSFINDQLASMIAAEELGGPVVGELNEIDDEMLEVGFSTQGKPKTKKSKGKESSDAKRQQRIDEIWGSRADSNAPNSEHAAAREELISLIEDLVQALNGASEKGVYVELSRDSAAARFLVRAKVAQYHPKDSRKLRLINFGRDIDD